MKGKKIKYKQYKGKIGFIPDACRKCHGFILGEPCACEHDCERVDFEII